jgi:hypothetical protein
MDHYGHLIAILMGGMAEGLGAPSWPPAIDPSSSDSLAIARLINHLNLSKADYDSAVAIATHWLDDPFVKSAIATVAHELGRHGGLTDGMVRDALGPQMLQWFARAEQPEGLAA